MAGYGSNQSEANQVRRDAKIPVGVRALLGLFSRNMNRSSRPLVVVSIVSVLERLPHGPHSRLYGKLDCLRPNASE